MDRVNEPDSNGESLRAKTGATVNWFLTDRQQVVAGTITIICLSVMIVSQIVGSWRRGRSINIDRTFTAPVVEFRVDINAADWPELTLLPDISETMARRIVEYRESHGQFRVLDEIKNVKGIGPRTFAKMEQYLLPISPEHATKTAAVESISTQVAND